MITPTVAIAPWLYIVDPREATGHYGCYPAPLANLIVRIHHYLTRGHRRADRYYRWLDTCDKAETFQHYPKQGVTS